jgi:hypothetical protein
MADYEKIMAARPEVGDFVRARLRIRYRGEVMAYGRNIQCDAFSTDDAGFRHSTLGEKKYSLAQCLGQERYGIVLGASNSFGFGVGGNENTLASVLAQQFGFPFANASMPGANSRNLHSLLLALVARARRLPLVVVHSSGGDLSTFCEASVGDPVFGSPNRGQLKAMRKIGRPLPDPERTLPNLLAFTSLWTSALASICRGHNIAFVLVHQSTFFEKKKANAQERQFSLGEATHDTQRRQFDNHRKFNEPFFVRRKEVADRLGVPLAGWALMGDLPFIDEFHCDREGIAILSKPIGDAIETLLPFCS